MFCLLSPDRPSEIATDPKNFVAVHEEDFFLFFVVFFFMFLRMDFCLIFLFTIPKDTQRMSPE